MPTDFEIQAEYPMIPVDCEPVRFTNLDQPLIRNSSTWVSRNGTWKEYKTFEAASSLLQLHNSLHLRFAWYWWMPASCHTPEGNKHSWRPLSLSLVSCKHADNASQKISAPGRQPDTAVIRLWRLGRASDLNLPEKGKNADILWKSSVRWQSSKRRGWLAWSQADVTLRGYSGYNTRWALHIMEEILPNSIHSPRYDFATLWFGANDAALPDRCKWGAWPQIHYMINLPWKACLKLEMAIIEIQGRVAGMAQLLLTQLTGISLLDITHNQGLHANIPNGRQQQSVFPHLQCKATRAHHRIRG